MRRAASARKLGDQAADRSVAVPVELAQIDLAHDAAAGTTTGQPRATGADRGADAWTKQRLGTGGQVQVMFDFIPSSVEHIRSGKLRALGVTTTARAAALPDVPTLGEFVPAYEASGWFGLGAPRNTPVEIVDAINKETNAILADGKVKARLADLGGTVLTGFPADFGKLIGVESDKWAKVVKFSGAKPG